AQVVLRAHHSNFKIVGFTTEPEIGEIVTLAHLHGAIFIDDLGSGALLDTARFGLEHEPMVQESVRSGADLVCFSGDKLLGGPQAGIIVGRKELIEKVRKAPLARAVRADKLCLAALSATLMHYLKGEAEKSVPIWEMVSQSAAQVQRRTEALKKKLGRGEILPGTSTIGGGSLPEETLPTFVLSIEVPRPDQVSKRLRRAGTPIITRIEQDRIVIDMRTVLPGQDTELAASLAKEIQ
ncbi:L-seryl-tRNA(Sec) selenium transferase, partial [bacterium]|nr:L-seryl-tRNA(Sec) selenium transferase [bacterium]